jgi:hypothetical protein
VMTQSIAVDRHVRHLDEAHVSAAGPRRRSPGAQVNGPVAYEIGLVSTESCSARVPPPRTRDQHDQCDDAGRRDRRLSWHGDATSPPSVSAEPRRIPTVHPLFLGARDERLRRPCRTRPSFDVHVHVLPDAMVVTVIPATSQSGSRRRRSAAACPDDAHGRAEAPPHRTWWTVGGRRRSAPLVIPVEHERRRSSAVPHERDHGFAGPCAGPLPVSMLTR